MCKKTPNLSVSRAGGLINNEVAKSKSLNTETIVSQNLLGLKSEARLEEFFFSLRKRKLLAACIQETWRHGSEILDNRDCRLFLTGLKKDDMKSNRGEQGVGIALSGKGVAAWKDAGSVLHDDLGARVIAIRLNLKDVSSRSVPVFLVSAYCPVGDASTEIWDEFFSQLDACVARKEKEDLLVVGTDCNSSIGTMNRSSHLGMASVGPYGCSHVNDAGVRFRSYLETNNFAAATTFFQKKTYETWIHPRSKKGHQIDHFITAKKNFGRFMDAGRTAPLIGSDHMAVMCKLRVSARLKKRTRTSCQNS